MLRRGFKLELRWFLLWFCLTVLAGFLTGYLSYMLIAFGLGYICHQFFRLYQLENWIRQARRQQPPPHELQGLWADIADDVLLMHNRHEKEKLRLQTVVHRVQEMTTALSDGVILIDSRGNISWWNRAAGELFNFQEIDLGQKITNLIRHPRFVRYYEHGRYKEPLDYTLPHKNTIKIEFLIHPFGQNERLIIVRDISRLTKLEEMRKDFVANVSHELRTPLTVLRGYLETMEDADNTPPVWKKALGQMQGQAQRMTSLINDLIVLTKLETDEKDQSKDIIDIAKLIKSIIDDANILSGNNPLTGNKNHLISMHCTIDMYIYGREQELRSALSNLVINAINYTPKNGAILIDCQQNKRGTMITVSDNGDGIDPKHIPRLTERFYRVDPSRSVTSGGTGLGLAIVKHVLLRHNGELRINSQIGRGSEFKCYFPPARTAQ
ncbi:MAG: phosphate regulon sensor histidine kinase PhoR [Marinagarivorans sp.]|nr:phosphate regulon sensor histidine kinase PhoR [Marinagarivorans sp.]